MKPRMPSWREHIVSTLLEAYERSKSFGQPPPWRRDVILPISPRFFPDAFAPEGREMRAALLASVAELEREGTARVVRHARGPLRGEPKEIRLGAAELESAYAEAETFDFIPLGDLLAELSERAHELLDAGPPPWMESCLERVAESGIGGLAALGISHERLKDFWPAPLEALNGATELACGIEPGWERIVSERLFGDSKRLAELRPLVTQILLRADPRWEGIPLDDASSQLEAYGVRRKPGLIRCAGAFPIRAGDSSFSLEDFVPVAHLPEAWAEPWVEGLAAAGTRTLTTIENEIPFFAYVEEAGGPAGLGARGEVVVYTAGFPTPALVSALAAVARRAPRISFRHWGDADVGGIRIWWFLRQRLARQIEPLRTTASWIGDLPLGLEAALSPAERDALTRLRAEIGPIDAADVREVTALIDALLARGSKFEQERY